jgi:plastocyanin
MKSNRQPPSNSPLYKGGEYYCFEYYRQLVIVVILIVSAPGVFAGTIRGNVKAQARPEVQEDIDAGKYASRKYKFLERINYDDLKDFVVYIDQEVPGKNSAPTKPVQVVIQRDAIFSPHVLPVMVGTTVQWPNNDDIYHNVFSMSEAKQFDLGFYRSDEIKRVIFDKPGRVDVFCSIHTRMSCIILVLENPFFSSTDKNGNYRISNVPAGTYRLRAWHERLPGQVKTITVPETGEVIEDFVLSVTGLPKY